MKIEIRKAKEHKAMSRETIAYNAEVYADGVLVAHARNDGGGAIRDSYDWVCDAKTRAAVLKAYPDGALDDVIAKHLTTLAVTKMAQADFKTRIFVLDGSGKVLATKKMPAAVRAKATINLRPGQRLATLDEVIADYCKQAG